MSEAFYRYKKDYPIELQSKFELLKDDTDRKDIELESTQEKLGKALKQIQALQVKVADLEQAKSTAQIT